MRKTEPDLKKRDVALDRRQFLRGAGGLLVSIPFLDSLLPRSLASAAPGARKRFVAMLSDHGGAWGADLHPAQATLTESLSYAGYTVRRGALALASASGRASLSPILSAPSGSFTPGMAAKMNVLRGLGIPFYGSHHRGGFLGDWATQDGNPHNLSHRPTIDNIIAYSPGFYESAPLARVMVCGFDHPSIGSASWNYENPTDRTGPVKMSSPAGSSRRLFDRVYAPSKGTVVNPRRPVVDRVLEDYKRLRGNTRLSARDRERLDAHIAHLNDLDQKLTRPQVSCGNVAPVADTENSRFASEDTNPALAAERLQLWCDVVALAFSCDTSRIAVIPLAHFSDWTGTGTRDFHQAIAHQAGAALDATLSIQVDAPHPRYRLADTYQRMFEKGFLYLANKLDAMADGAGTVLDSSLLTWTHEAGLQTHEQTDLPVISAGSAGGAIKTGFAADYRNMAWRWPKQDSKPPEQLYPGLFWHQYLGSVMQAMGVAPSFYQSGPYGGYGDDYFDKYQKEINIYPDAILRARGELLPFLG